MGLVPVGPDFDDAEFDRRQRVRAAVMIAIVVALLVFAAATAFGADRYAQHGGTGTACNVGSPCSVPTAIGQLVTGDNLLLVTGTYDTTDGLPWTIAADGTDVTPINVKPASPPPAFFPVQIDCHNVSGYCVMVTGDHVNLWNLHVNDIGTGPRNCSGCNGAGGLVPPAQPDGGGIRVSGKRDGVFNCLIHNRVVGIETGATPQQGAQVIGNLSYLNGYDDTALRGSGHEFYTQNSTPYNNTDPALIPLYSNNVIWGDWYMNVHGYGQTSPVAPEGLLNFLNYVNNVSFDGAEPSKFPAQGTPFEIGANGGAACAAPDWEGAPGGVPSSMKLAMNPVYDSNDAFTFQTGDSDVYVYTKGIENVTMTNNYFVVKSVGSVPISLAGPICGSANDIHGNTFVGKAGALVQGVPIETKFPTNSWLTSYPSSGKVFHPRPNPFEVGRGSGTLFNWDLSSTYALPLDQMGAYVNEHYMVKACQNPLGASLASGTYSGGTVTVPTTSTVEVPTGDPTTFDQPTTTGPVFMCYLLFDAGGEATTPTPTITQTPTATRTFTPTATPTPSTIVLYDAVGPGAIGKSEHLTSGGAATPFSITIGGNTNRYLLVEIADNLLANSVTANGVAMTRLSSAQNGGQKGEVWGLANPSPGATSIQITFPASDVSYAAGATSYVGVSGVGGIQTATGNGTTATLSMISMPNNRVVDLLSRGSKTSSPAPTGAGQVMRWQNSTGSGFFGGSSSDMPGAASANPTWTLASSTWALIAVELISVGNQGVPSYTPTPTNTGTPTLTFTSTNTSTPTQTNTPTVTPSETPTLSPTPITVTPTFTYTPSSTSTPTLTPSVTPSPTSTATFTATQTPTNSQTPTRTPTFTRTPSLTPTPIPTPAAPFVFYQSGDDASAVVAPVTLSSGVITNSGPNNNAGYAEWSFSTPTDGPVIVWGRVLAATSSTDSWFVSMDGGAQDVYDVAEGTWSPLWQWSMVNGRAGTGVPKTLNPRVFDLLAGPHVIRFTARDAGAQISEVVFTNDPSYVGVDATPTPTPSITPTFTSTPTLTSTATPTSSATPTLTNTNTATNTPTYTPSITSTATQTNTPTPSFTPTRTNTNTPSNTPTFTATNTVTATRTPSVTKTATPWPTATPTPNGGRSPVFSVAACTWTLPMILFGDPTAQGGFAATALTADGALNPANGGVLDCPFNITQPGVYRGWALTNTLDASHQATYVTYDAETIANINDHVFYMGEHHDCVTTEYGTLWGQGWTWNPLNDSNHGCAGSPGHGYERTVNLGAGLHHVYIHGRDTSAQIAFLIFTTDMSYDPRVAITLLCPPFPTVTPNPRPH